MINPPAPAATVVINPPAPAAAALGIAATRLRRLACAALLFSFTSLQPAAAQEFGLYGSVGSSELAELNAPRGFGGYVRVVPLSGISMRLSYHRQEERSARIGVVCNNYPAFKCNPEEIENETRVATGAVAAGLLLRPFSPLELEFSGGISVNEVRSSERTASGRPSPLMFTQTAQLGLLTMAHARVRPLRAVPLSIEVGVALHLLRLDACSDDFWAHAPYCGATNVRDIRAGVSYVRR
jgi:hypothetical protein